MTSQSGLSATAGSKPNVVVFLSDDQGWGDIGLRDPSLSTPELDALFREGVELARFYAAAPVCSPTRASGKNDGATWPTPSSRSLRS